MCARSELLPVDKTTSRLPIARPTLIEASIVAVHASAERGLTMPVVPRIDMPPTMPRRLLSVFLAIASPSVTLTVTSMGPAAYPAGCPASVTASMIASAIIFLGTGFMAASPGGMQRPGRVTTPTPFPPLTIILFSARKLVRP